MRDIYEKFNAVSHASRRGRKRQAARVLQDFWACNLYRRWLTWLRARQRRSGLPDSPTIDWWRGAPHERAARMVARRLRGRNLSHRAVLNMVSRLR